MSLDRENNSDNSDNSDHSDLSDNDVEIRDIIRDQNLIIETSTIQIRTPPVHVDTPIPTNSNRMHISTLTIPSLNIVRNITNTPSPLARNIRPNSSSPIHIINYKHKGDKYNMPKSNSYPECLCCYDTIFPISKRLLETCNAEIKHNICYNCYKITSSKKCFFCFPLDKGNFLTRGNGNFGRALSSSITMINQYPGNIENIIISQNESPREGELSYHQHLRNTRRNVRARQHEQMNDCNHFIQIVTCIIIIIVLVFYSGNDDNENKNGN